MLTSSYFVPQQCVTGTWTDIAGSSIVKDLYADWGGVNWRDTYFVLGMPAIGGYEKISIPSNVKHVVLSCHIEPIDIDWLRETALAHPDTDICVLFDGLYAPPSEFYPGNVRLFPWLSWHWQLRRMDDIYGHREQISRPRYWASSLCNRSAQFKLYVTAYCINKHYTDRVLVSYHRLVDKASDVDHMRTGHELLDHLADLIENQTPLLIDHSNRSERDLPSPSNRDWRFPQHTDCLFNFTNEGFHYSLKMTPHANVIWPGPDLSEKTFKALLAGQAILPVGQWKSIAALRQLGFRFDYGLNLDFDNIPGDIDRMLVCLPVIDDIMSTSLDDLFDLTLESSTHNVNWAVSDDFHQQCEQINQQSLTELVQWLEI
jgi:hypothetical protein